MRLPNIISGFVMVCVGVFFFTNTFTFPTLALESVGPAFMPRVYSGLLIIFGASLAIKGFMEKNASEGKSQNNFLYVLIAMLIVTVYIVLVQFIGFYIATLVFCVGFLVFLKIHQKLILFAVPVGAILFVYIFFEKILKVPIPVGSLFG